MPPHARHAGTAPGPTDSLAAGQGRQKLKLGAIGLVTARHGVDATVELAHAAVVYYCQMGLEYYEALMGTSPKNRPVDPYLQFGEIDVPEVKRSRERFVLAGFAYAGARHGIDADAGMARTGMALMAQAALEYYETLVRVAPKKQPTEVPRQIGNGIR